MSEQPVNAAGDLEARSSDPNDSNSSQSTVVPVPPPLPPARPLFKGNRYGFASESHDLDEVSPNLFIGSWQAACDVELLKKLGITHILTIEETELPDEVKSQFVYKFKKLTDSPYMNVLALFDDCFEFIESALNNSNGILVHCLVGMSRSASIVTGFLMRREKWTFKKALDQIRRSRFIKPNLGFQKQLEFFEKMDYKLPKESAAFKAFMLEKMAEHVQMGGRFNEFKPSEFSDEASDSAKKSDENVASYKCKKCRFKLFTANSLVKHIKNFEASTGDSTRSDLQAKYDYYQKLNENSNECTSELYIEPLDWFVSKLSDLNGKLNCPKCDAKLGSFDWCGSKCACSTWVVPAFHISSSKVDFCPSANAPLGVKQAI